MERGHSINNAKYPTALPGKVAMKSIQEPHNDYSITTKERLLQNMKKASAASSTIDPYSYTDDRREYEQSEFDDDEFHTTSQQNDEWDEVVGDSIASAYVVTHQNGNRSGDRKINRKIDTTIDVADAAATGASSNRDIDGDISGAIEAVSSSLASSIYGNTYDEASPLRLNRSGSNKYDNQLPVVDDTEESNNKSNSNSKNNNKRNNIVPAGYDEEVSFDQEEEGAGSEIDVIISDDEEEQSNRLLNNEDAGKYPDNQRKTHNRYGNAANNHTSNSNIIDQTHNEEHDSNEDSIEEPDVIAIPAIHAMQYRYRNQLSQYSCQQTRNQVQYCTNNQNNNNHRDQDESYYGYNCRANDCTYEQPYNTDDTSNKEAEAENIATQEEIDEMHSQRSAIKSTMQNVLRKNTPRIEQSDCLRSHLDDDNNVEVRSERTNSTDSNNSDHPQAVPPPSYQTHLYYSTLNGNPNNINTSNNSQNSAQSGPLPGIRMGTGSSSRLMQRNPLLSPNLAPYRARRVLIVKDYDFSERKLTHFMNAPLEIRLANDVPVHVEHIFVGICHTDKRLCLESPLIQQGQRSSFQFIPMITGEIELSCKIYTDMKCLITVIDPAVVAQLMNNKSSNNSTINSATSSSAVAAPPLFGSTSRIANANAAASSPNIAITNNRPPVDNAHSHSSTARKDSTLSEADDDDTVSTASFLSDSQDDNDSLSSPNRVQSSEDNKENNRNTGISRELTMTNSPNLYNSHRNNANLAVNRRIPTTNTGNIPLELTINDSMCGQSSNMLAMYTSGESVMTSRSSNSFFDSDDEYSVQNGSVSHSNSGSGRMDSVKEDDNKDTIEEVNQNDNHPATSASISITKPIITKPNQSKPAITVQSDTGNIPASAIRISIENFTFRPSSINILQNQLVAFIVRSTDRHHLCGRLADTANTQNTYGSMDSAVIDEMFTVELSGMDQYFLFEFRDTGKFIVTDEIFKFMVCYVNVQSGVKPTAYAPNTPDSTADKQQLTPETLPKPFWNVPSADRLFNNENVRNNTSDNAVKNDLLDYIGKKYGSSTSKRLVQQITSMHEVDMTNGTVAIDGSTDPTVKKLFTDDIVPSNKHNNKPTMSLQGSFSIPISPPVTVSKGNKTIGCNDMTTAASERATLTQGQVLEQEHSTKVPMNKFTNSEYDMIFEMEDEEEDENAVRDGEDRVDGDEKRPDTHSEATKSSKKPLEDGDEEVYRRVNQNNGYMMMIDEDTTYDVVVKDGVVQECNDPVDHRSSPKPKYPIMEVFYNDSSPQNDRQSTATESNSAQKAVKSNGWVSENSVSSSGGAHRDNSNPSSLTKSSARARKDNSTDVHTTVSDLVVSNFGPSDDDLNEVKYAGKTQKEKEKSSYSHTNTQKGTKSSRFGEINGEGWVRNPYVEDYLTWGDATQKPQEASTDDIYNFNSITENFNYTTEQANKIKESYSPQSVSVPSNSTSSYWNKSKLSHASANNNANFQNIPVNTEKRWFEEDNATSSQAVERQPLMMTEEQRRQYYTGEVAKYKNTINMFNNATKNMFQPSSPTATTTSPSTGAKTSPSSLLQNPSFSAENRRNFTGIPGNNVVSNVKSSRYGNNYNKETEDIEMKELNLFNNKITNSLTDGNTENKATVEGKRADTAASTSGNATATVADNSKSKRRRQRRNAAKKTHKSSTSDEAGGSDEDEVSDSEVNVNEKESCGSSSTLDEAAVKVATVSAFSASKPPNGMQLPKSGKDTANIVSPKPTKLAPDALVDGNCDDAIIFNMLSTAKPVKQVSSSGITTTCTTTVATTNTVITTVVASASTTTSTHSSTSPTTIASVSDSTSSHTAHNDSNESPSSSTSSTSTKKKKKNKKKGKSSTNTGSIEATSAAASGMNNKLRLPSIVEEDGEDNEEEDEVVICDDDDEEVSRDMVTKTGSFFHKPDSGLVEAVPVTTESPLVSHTASNEVKQLPSVSEISKDKGVANDKAATMVRSVTVTDAHKEPKQAVVVASASAVTTNRITNDKNANATATTKKSTSTIPNISIAAQITQQSTTTNKVTTGENKSDGVIPTPINKAIGAATAVSTTSVSATQPTKQASNSKPTTVPVVPTVATSIPKTAAEVVTKGDKSKTTLVSTTLSTTVAKPVDNKIAVATSTKAESSRLTENSLDHISSSTTTAATVSKKAVEKTPTKAPQSQVQLAVTVSPSDNKKPSPNAKSAAVAKTTPPSTSATTTDLNAKSAAVAKTSVQSTSATTTDLNAKFAAVAKTSVQSTSATTTDLNAKSAAVAKTTPPSTSATTTDSVVAPIVTLVANNQRKKGTSQVSTVAAIAAMSSSKLVKPDTATAKPVPGTTPSVEPPTTATSGKVKHYVAATEKAERAVPDNMMQSQSVGKEAAVEVPPKDATNLIMKKSDDTNTASNGVQQSSIQEGQIYNDDDTAVTEDQTYTVQVNNGNTYYGIYTDEFDGSYSDPVYSNGNEQPPQEYMYMLPDPYMPMMMVPAQGGMAAMPPPMPMGGMGGMALPPAVYPMYYYPALVQSTVIPVHAMDMYNNPNYSYGPANGYDNTNPYPSSETIANPPETYQDANENDPAIHKLSITSSDHAQHSPTTNGIVGRTSHNLAGVVNDMLDTDVEMTEALDNHVASNESNVQHHSLTQKANTTVDCSAATKNGEPIAVPAPEMTRKQGDESAEEEIEFVFMTDPIVETAIDDSSAAKSAKEGTASNSSRNHANLGIIGKDGASGNHQETDIVAHTDMATSSIPPAAIEITSTGTISSLSDPTTIAMAPPPPILSSEDMKNNIETMENYLMKRWCTISNKLVLSSKPTDALKTGKVVPIIVVKRQEWRMKNTYPNNNGVREVDKNIDSGADSNRSQPSTATATAAPTVDINTTTSSKTSAPVANVEKTNSVPVNTIDNQGNGSEWSTVVSKKKNALPSHTSNTASGSGKLPGRTIVPPNDKTTVSSQSRENKSDKAIVTSRGTNKKPSNSSNK